MKTIITVYYDDDSTLEHSIETGEAEISMEEAIRYISSRVGMFADEQGNIWTMKHVDRYSISLNQPSE